MKLIDILKTANGNILQSKLRTFLTIIAIFVGAFTLTLTNGVGSGITRYINGQVASIGATNVLMIQAKQASATGSSTDPVKYDPTKLTATDGAGPGDGRVTLLTTSDLQKIKSVSGITDATPDQSVTPSYIIGPNGNKYVISASSYIEGTNIAMDAGTVPSNASSQPELTIPYNYVSFLGFSSYSNAIGKQVALGIPDAAGDISEVTGTVVGVPEKSFISTGAANINSALFTNLYAIQSRGLPASQLDAYDSVIAHFDSSYTAAQTADLKSRLSSAGYTGETIADQISSIEQIINGIVIVFDIFAIITLVAASFGVINTLLMSVQERTKEIGLMKALGMGRGRIFMLFSVEAILLGFWGSFLGVLSAVGTGEIINKVATHKFLQDFEGLHLLAFPIGNLAIIIGSIMVIAFLAGTLPARRASRLNPIEALRYE